jgi:hypothetical protein
VPQFDEAVVPISWEMDDLADRLEKAEAPTETWEMDDLADRLKEPHDPYVPYIVARRGGWRIYTTTYTAVSSPRTFKRSDDEVAEEFAALANEWRGATAVESGLERIILNSAYQRIIGLGPQALPHILRDMKETRDHWFWALMSIVGEDKAVGQTSVGAAVEAWLAWGREAGLIDE